MKIEFMENEIINKAKSVFDFAYIKALENDLKVLKVKDNSLYECDSDGNEIFRKEIKKYKVEKKSFRI